MITMMRMMLLMLTMNILNIMLILLIMVMMILIVIVKLLLMVLEIMMLMMLMMIMMTKFSWKKGNLSPHFFMIFEYFGCLGARPGGLGHILSPRLGFLWFLRFARCEKLPPFWPKNDKKSFKNRSQTQQVFRSLFWSTLEPSWGRFDRILGAKMEPKLIQNRSQERSWRKFKNH